MATTTFSGPVVSTNGFVSGVNPLLAVKKISIDMTNGVDVAGTTTLPTGAVVLKVIANAPTAFGGSPTSVNLRLGSAADGNEYAANTDVKAGGVFDITIKSPLVAVSDATIHYTLDCTIGGGTLNDVDQDVDVYFIYYVPA